MSEFKFLSLDRFKQLARSGQVPNETGVYKQFAAEVKVENDSRRELLFTISAETIDRDGDKIAVDGWQLDNYRKNPVVLWAHQYSGLPVGRSKQVWPEGGKLKSIAEFAPPELSEFADRVYRFYKEGFMSAVSVGFLPKKWAWAEDTDRKYGIDFESQELLEYSMVPVPAHPDALIEARAAGNELFKSVREFENFLRESAGFSRNDATLLASRGWTGLAQRDSELDECVRVVQQFRNSLR